MSREIYRGRYLLPLGNRLSDGEKSLKNHEICLPNTIEIKHIYDVIVSLLASEVIVFLHKIWFFVDIIIYTIQSSKRKSISFTM